MQWVSKAALEARSVPRVFSIAGLVVCMLSSAALPNCRANGAKGRGNEPSPTSVQQSCAALELQRNALSARLSTLHQQLDALPPDLPGLGEPRGKLFAAEEVLGVTGAKLTWLSSQVDSAAKMSKPEELLQVSKETASTAKEMQQVDRVAFDLTHQLFALERNAALFSKDAGAGPSIR